VVKKWMLFTGSRLGYQKVTIGDRDRTLSKNEHATTYGYVKEEVKSGAGSISAFVWHTGRGYIERTHRWKRQFQNSNGFIVVERESEQFKETG
jgi:hypothetical protein